jgi:hypothetical protein
MKMPIVLPLLFALFSQSVLAGPFVSVCERTNQVRSTLEKVTGKQCQEIDADDLLEIDGLIMNNLQIFGLRDGDFSGLDNVTILNLDNNPMGHLNANILAELPNLQSLSVRDIGMAGYSPGFFDQNQRLISIALGDPSLQFIGPRTFANLPNILVVDVTESPLENTEKGAFWGVQTVNGLPTTFSVDPNSSLWSDQ